MAHRGPRLLNSWIVSTDAINAAFVDSKTRAQLLGLGGTLLADSPGEFRTLIAEETQKWARVVKFSSVRPD